MIPLVLDVGGSHIKLRAGNRRPALKLPSGPTMTPEAMVAAAQTATAGWTYDAVSIGYPGVVLHGRIVSEPRNLGPGWIGFNFARAFGHPVRLINDAAMQAWGSYRGGRMLFLGLGTGLGAALIVDGTLEAMELAHLPYRKGKTYEDYVGKAGLERLGRRKWRRYVRDVIVRWQAALEVDDVVIGGGNAKLVKKFPPGVRLGSNADAFVGGVRLWTTPETPARRAAARRRAGALKRASPAVRRAASPRPLR